MTGNLPGSEPPLAKARRRLIALYGSLAREFPGQDEIGVRGALEYVGPCVLRGDLYSLGPWPGMTPGKGKVEAELYRPMDGDALRKLDEFERYDEARPAGSLYMRVAARLLSPAGTVAWTYVYNRPINGEPRVPHGSWKRHVRERAR